MLNLKRSHLLITFFCRRSKKSKKSSKKSKSSRRRSRSDSRDRSRRDRGSRRRSRRSRSRSRSRDRRRSRSRDRAKVRTRSPSPDAVPTVPTRAEAKEVDAISVIQRDRAIADIESKGFNQASFSSSASAKIAQVRKIILINHF